MNLSFCPGVTNADHRLFHKTKQLRTPEKPFQSQSGPSALQEEHTMCDGRWLYHKGLYSNNVQNIFLATSTWETDGAK